MSQMKMFHVMERMMEQNVEEALRKTVRSMWSEKTHEETDDFVQEVLEALGLRVGIPLGKQMPWRRETPPPSAEDDDDDDDYALIPALVKADDTAAAAVAPVAPAAEVAAGDGDAGKDRKRTVSKKMKDTFLAMEGGTEESLKAAMKIYKAADQAQIDAWGGKWDAFARAFLAGECTPVKKTPAKKAPAKKAAADPDAPVKAKKEKEAKNFTWTPTAKKLFTEVVEGNGGTVTDALKTEFVAHVNAMDVEKFKMVAPVGHIRAFIASKAPGASRPVHDTEGKVLGFTTTPPPESAAEDDDDEDLEVIDVDGEELTIGVKSGKIYRATEDSGDVQIGVAGEGKFKDVKIPSA